MIANASMPHYALAPEVQGFTLTGDFNIKTF